jgi:aryl-alcohol dehydrogenase-like predicted oxidoreductase
MRYKLFGRSGLRVSEICLGAGGFGLDAKKLGLAIDWGGCDQEMSQAIFEAYAAAGGNFIDTSSVYGDGASEMIGWPTDQVGPRSFRHRHEIYSVTRFGYQQVRQLPQEHAPER